MEVAVPSKEFPNLESSRMNRSLPDSFSFKVNGDSLWNQGGLLYMCAHVCTCVCVCQSLIRVQLSVTPWTVVYQAPLESIEFSTQEYWSG